MKNIVWVILCLAFVLFLPACSSGPRLGGNNVVNDAINSEVESMNARSVLFVIAHENFQDNEFGIPRDILKAKGCKIVVASSGSSTATGALGGKVTPDISLDEALSRIDEFNAVIFIGGGGASEYFNSPVAHQIARDAKDVVAGICIAPVILANAGVLDGKKATVWDDGKGTQKKLIESKGAVFVSQPVVVDGKLVTANGPSAAKLFGERIAELLAK
jgi:protease I